MSLVRRIIYLPLYLALVACLTSDAWSQADGLSARVPTDANTIVILNVDKIMASPIAQRENWSQRRERAAAAGLTILPAAASHFMMAAKLDLEFMHPIWEVALARVKYDPSMPRIAAKWGGNIDRVAGRDAVLLGDDSYVLRLGPTTLASRRPADRQSITRWLRQTDISSGKNLSPYLNKAIDYSDQLGTPIVMALDLEGVASAATIEQRLADFESIKGSGSDAGEVAKALEAIQGITLGINVKDTVSGAMIIDIDGDTSPLKDIAKPLLLEILAKRSAMIDEFSDWRAVVEPNRVRIGGQLNASGLQRLMSIFDAPASLHQFAPSPGEAPDPKLEAQLATQQNFKAVTGLVEDLREKPGKKTAGQVGIWWARYADKIDKLPMLNVDEAMLDYRSFVSSSLRDGSSALRDVGGRSRVRELNAPAQYTSFGRYGANGFYGDWGESTRLEAQDRTRIRTEERTQGARSAREIMSDIERATVDIRRQMTEKYQVEF